VLRLPVLKEDSIALPQNLRDYSPVDTEQKFQWTLSYVNYMLQNSGKQNTGICSCLFTEGY